MTNIITEISKYLIIFCMIMYTYLNFHYFHLKKKEKQDRICKIQNQMMFVMHFFCFSVIYLKSEDERILAFYGMQVLFLAGFLVLYRLFYKHLSRILLNNMCMFLCIGFIILTRLSLDRAVKQFVIVVISALITWIIPYIIDHVWQLSSIPWVYCSLGVCLLLFVYVVGVKSFGAQLSLDIAGFSFQPSEFVKISFVFFVATMFYRSTDFKSVVRTSLVAAVHVLILVLSKDLGGALIFFLTYLFMLFIATSKWIYLGLGTMLGTVAAVISYHLFSHVHTRVEAWLNPWLDIDNKGYQITQSLFAIGTGGWFGSGLYEGMPKKIPVVEKDFVFAAISEELGGVFAVCLVFLCFGCYLQLIKIATRMQAVFYKLIAFGLGIVYITQVFLNIGGVVKFIPSTGVTLPFISYGGSSILSTMIMFSVIQGLYILKQSEEDEYE